MERLFLLLVFPIFVSVRVGETMRSHATQHVVGCFETGKKGRPSRFEKEDEFPIDRKDGIRWKPEPYRVRGRGKRKECSRVGGFGGRG